MERLADVMSLLATYANGYDTGNWESIGECFTPDGVFELVDDDGNTKLVVNGTDEINDFMRASLEEQRDVRRHFSTNLRVLEWGDDQVRVASYLLLGVAEKAGLRVVQSGRYEDLVVWVDGRAKFAHRLLTMDGVF